MNDLERKLASLDCGETGGWLSDDLECGVDGEPWCLSHQLQASETARREAERQSQKYQNEADDWEVRESQVRQLCRDYAHWFREAFNKAEAAERRVAELTDVMQHCYDWHHVNEHRKGRYPRWAAVLATLHESAPMVEGLERAEFTNDSGRARAALSPQTAEPRPLQGTDSLLRGAVQRYLTLVRTGPDDEAYEALCELDRIAFSGRAMPEAGK